MDSLTHIVLGACIGEIILDKNAGRKAMLWGALAQSVPDIDFIAGSWMPVSQELLAHRGLTHSFLFGFFIAFFLALVAARWHKAEPISFKKWYVLFIVEILCHLLLDAMNNYGIGWFEPFSSRRISFNVLYVADPLFSIVPLIAFLFLLFLKTNHWHRLRWARVGVFVSSLYLLFALFNKYSINKKVEAEIHDAHLSGNIFFTTPTLLNNFLWFVVVKDSTGFNLGYKSIFNKSCKLKLTHFNQNDSLLNPVHDHQEVMDLKKFSQGYYTAEKWGDTLVLNDLRFGQINGWENPNSRFAFHYFISHPTNNDLIVQRGRFAGFNAASSKVLMNRMFGEQ